MAHMVETLAYAGETPWHGLGRRLANRVTAADIIREAGLDWMVVERDVYAQGADDFVPANGYKALVRETDGSVLSIVSGKYGIVQNAQLGDLAEAMAGEGVQAFEVGGSLRDGKHVFLVGVTGEAEIAGDRVKNYLTLCTSHDASLAVTAFFSPVRVVCNNTLQAALSGNEQGHRLTVKHTSKASDRVAIAAGVCKAARSYFGTFTETALRLVEQRLSTATFGDIARSLFPAYVNAAGERVVPENGEKVVRLFRNLQGSVIDRHLAGTAWGGYQAVTALLDHNRKNTGPQARMGRFLQGSDDAIRTKAVGLLLAA